MITNCKVDLNEEQRRQVSRNVFGSNREVTRKEVNMLVAQLFEILTGDTHERMPEVQALQPEPEVAEHTSVHAPVVRVRAADGTGPKQPNNASYMRGWNAVAKATRRMR